MILREDQWQWQGRRRRVLLLLLLAAWGSCCVVSVAMVTQFAMPRPQELGRLSVAEWTAIYANASGPLERERLFRHGPRIRAKILVAEQLSFMELLSGEGTIRQQLGDVAGVATNRIFIEYIETNCLHEGDRGAYSISVGISALVPPESIAPNGNDGGTGTIGSTALLMDVVDAERTRLANQLQYGGLVRGVNTTIANLRLFGSWMQLLDVVVDGELFYQLDFKPWILANLVFAADSEASTPAGVLAVASDSSLAFRNLRLRFLLVNWLHALQPDTSSFIIRDPWSPPFHKYGVFASVVPIEIHIGDSVKMADAVDSYLRNTSLVDLIKTVEPQWTLLSVDVDGAAGQLEELDPPGSINHTTTEDSGDPYKTKLSFQVLNLPILHVEGRQWRILDAIRTTIKSAIGQVAFDLSVDQIDLPTETEPTTSPSAQLAPYDNFMNSVRHVDGIHAREYSLSIVVTSSSAIVDVTPLANALQGVLSSWMDVKFTLGFMEGVDAAMYPTSRVTFLGVAAWQSDGRNEVGSDTVMPYVGLNVTIAASASVAVAAPWSSPPIDAFMLHRLRCALLVLVKQVLLDNSQVEIVGMTRSTKGTQLLSVLSYRFHMQDESQRSALVRILSSQRLQRALEEFSSQRVRVVAVRVDRFGDTILWKTPTLPGTTDTAVNEAVTVITHADIDNGATYRTYRYADPQSPPGFPDSMSRPCPVPSFLAPPFTACVRIAPQSDYPSGSLFLRAITTSQDTQLGSWTLQLSPESTTEVVSIAMAAPWVALTGVAPAVEWELQLSSASPQTRLVLVFELADPSFSKFYPGPVLALTLDLPVGGSSQAVVAVERWWPSISPVATTLAPSQIETWLRDGVVMGDFTRRGPTEIVVGLQLTPSSLGGLFGRANSASAWGASCQSCATLFGDCGASLECNAMATCLRSIVDADALLFESVLRRRATLDVTEAMAQCLQPSGSPRPLWTDTARRLLVQGLLCAIRSACPVLASQEPPATQLVLQYQPREQLLVFQNASFASRLGILIDIHGGGGDSNDGSGTSGTTLSRAFDGLVATSEALTALRSALVTAFGPWGRGLEVDVTLTSDPATQESRVRVRYFFLDAAVASLPFLSVLGGTPAGITTTQAMDAMWLATTST